MNAEELSKIWASAPTDKFMFEVLKLSATWFTRDYYVQYAIEIDDYITVNIDDVETEVIFAPMQNTRNENNQDLAHERSFTIAFVNDILATEQSRFDPDIHDKSDFILTVYPFVCYENGEYLQSGDGHRLFVNSAPRNYLGTTFNVSSKPTNRTSTGEVNTNIRFPMQRGFK